MSRSLPLAALALLLPLTAGPAGAQSRFAVRVENVSTAATLRLSNGETAPAPTAPVLWVVHGGANPVFTPGRLDRDHGLEPLAEEGNPAALAAALARAAGVASVGAVDTPFGKEGPGPILPGDSYRFEVEGEPGQRLTLAMMFGQSNDLFYAPADGIDLFDARGRPVRGDLTSRFVLWDAGTEVNQEPGLGPDQAPRQPAPNTGTAERAAVAPVDDDFTYPPTNGVIRVTIEPVERDR